MSLTELYNGWDKLNAAIDLLKRKKIVDQYNSKYIMGKTKRFHNEEDLVTYLNTPPSSLRFKYSTFSQLKNAFDKRTGDKKLKYGAHQGNFDTVNHMLDSLIEETTEFYWHPTAGYIERTNVNNSIDSVNLSKLLGTYIGYFQSNGKQVKKFLFIISKDPKTKNGIVTLISNEKKRVNGEVCLIDENKLFFIMRTENKYSPELILCHMGGTFKEVEKIDHFIGLSAWYDYKFERPSAGICVFYKIDNNFSKSSPDKMKSYYSKISKDHIKKIEIFFEENNNNFIRLDTHFIES